MSVPARIMLDQEVVVQLRTLSATSGTLGLAVSLEAVIVDTMVTTTMEPVSNLVATKLIVVFGFQTTLQKMVRFINLP